MVEDIDGRSRLPFRLKTAPGVRWWLADEKWVPWAEAATAVVCTSRPGVGDAVLKDGRNRLMVRSPRPAGVDTGPESVILKAFPMRHERQALFGLYRKYGPSELAHLIMAAERGLPVPAVYGYVERRICGVWVAATGVLMEDFHEVESVLDVLGSDPTPERVDSAMSTVSDLILKLHIAGCNHADLHGDNLFLPSPGEETGKIIDFMYARFHESPSIEVFRFMVAYFAGSIAQHLDRARLDRWVDDTLSLVKDGGTLGHWADMISDWEGEMPSRHERMAVV